MDGRDALRAGQPAGIQTATAAAGRLGLYYGVIERERTVDLLNLLTA